MRALIVVASRHGSTRDIADEIAGELRACSLKVDVYDVGEAPNIEPYHVIVLGSAVYMGRMLPEILEFATANLASLTKKPVWVFSSGPIGDPPVPQEIPGDLVRLEEELGALGYRSFSGRLDPASLNVKERVLVKMVRATPGDFRRRNEISDWAVQIAIQLEAKHVPV